MGTCPMSPVVRRLAQSGSERPRMPVGSAKLSLSRLRCWWLHRRLWTIVNPGLLPFALDAERFCPVCNKMRGHAARPRLRLQGAGA